MRRRFALLILLLLNTCFAVAQTPYDSLTIVNLKWDTTYVQKGVLHRHVEVSMLYDCPQNINIIEVDMKKQKDLIGKIVNTPQLQQTSVTAKENDGLVAINGTFYAWQGNSVCFLRLGKTVVDTSSIADFSRASGAVVIDKKGRIDLSYWTKERELENIRKNKEEDIMTSGPMLLLKGKYLPLSKESSFNTLKHPRSVIATTKDKKLLLVTIDGRHPSKAEGINLFELSQLMKLLGAYNAINLDGGGSTTLWLDGAPHNGVLNKPSDNKTYDHEGERKIANLILLKKKNK